MEEQRAPSSSEALPIGSTKETDAGLVQALFPTLCFRPGGPAGLWEASRTLGSSYRTRNGPSWKEPHPGPHRGVRMNSLMKLGGCLGRERAGRAGLGPCAPLSTCVPVCAGIPKLQGTGAGRAGERILEGEGLASKLPRVSCPPPCEGCFSESGGNPGRRWSWPLRKCLLLHVLFLPSH